MIDGGGDKARIGKHLRDIVMTDERAAAAMRDDDKRELVAGDRTILHPGESDVAEIDLARCFRAGKPHRSVEGWTVRVGGHPDKLETGSLRECRLEKEGKRDEKTGGLQGIQM